MLILKNMQHSDTPASSRYGIDGRYSVDARNFDGRDYSDRQHDPNYEDRDVGHQGQYAQEYRKTVQEGQRTNPGGERRAYGEVSHQRRMSSNSNVDHQGYHEHYPPQQHSQHTQQYAQEYSQEFSQDYSQRHPRNYGATSKIGADGADGADDSRSVVSHRENRHETHTHHIVDRRRDSRQSLLEPPHPPQRLEAPQRPGAPQRAEAPQRLEAPPLRGPMMPLLETGPGGHRPGHARYGSLSASMSSARPQHRRRSSVDLTPRLDPGYPPNPTYAPSRDDFHGAPWADETSTSTVPRLSHARADAPAPHNPESTILTETKPDYSKPPPLAPPASRALHQPGPFAAPEPIESAAPPPYAMAPHTQRRRASASGSVSGSISGSEGLRSGRRHNTANVVKADRTGQLKVRANSQSRVSDGATPYEMTMPSRNQGDSVHSTAVCQPQRKLSGAPTAPPNAGEPTSPTVGPTVDSIRQEAQVVEEEMIADPVAADGRRLDEDMRGQILKHCTEWSTDRPRESQTLEAESSRLLQAPDEVHGEEPRRGDVREDGADHQEERLNGDMHNPEMSEEGSNELGGRDAGEEAGSERILTEQSLLLDLGLSELPFPAALISSQQNLLSAYSAPEFKFLSATAQAQIMDLGDRTMNEMVEDARFAYKREMKIMQEVDGLFNNFPDSNELNVDLSLLDELQTQVQAVGVAVDTQASALTSSGTECQAMLKDLISKFEQFEAYSGKRFAALDSQLDKIDAAAQSVLDDLANNGFEILPSDDLHDDGDADADAADIDSIFEGPDYSQSHSVPALS